MIINLTNPGQDPVNGDKLQEIFPSGGYRCFTFSAPEPQLKSTFSPLEWEMRFQGDEMWAMAEVAKLDRTAFKLMRQMDRAGDFNIADPRTIDGLNYVATLYDADGGEPYDLLPSPTRIAELLTPDAID